MWVHWFKKIMRFAHQGQRTTLLGLGQDVSTCAQISSYGLQGLLNQQNITCCLQLKLQGQPEMAIEYDQVVQTVEVDGENRLPASF